MLVLPGAGLVILETPRTGSQSLRAMLRADAVVAGPRHATASAYAAEAQAIAARFGRPFETIAVVREPLDRLQSWHRYRQRQAAAGGPRSTAGVDFERFLRAALSPYPPEFARVGRQDRFTGWDGKAAQIDRLFDFTRLDLLVGFLSQRIGRRLRLPHRNAAPGSPSGTPVSAEGQAMFARERAAEIALYRAVNAAGMLVRNGP